MRLSPTTLVGWLWLDVRARLDRAARRPERGASAIEWVIITAVLVGLAAQTHLGLAIHNFGIQEYMEHSEKTNTVFEQSMTFVAATCTRATNPALAWS